MLNTSSSDFFTPEVLDFVSRDYAAKGNKRLRSSRVLPDNEWILTKLGGGRSFAYLLSSAKKRCVVAESLQI